MSEVDRIVRIGLTVTATMPLQHKEYPLLVKAQIIKYLSQSPPESENINEYSRHTYFAENSPYSDPKVQRKVHEQTRVRIITENGHSVLGVMFSNEGYILMAKHYLGERIPEYLTISISVNSITHLMPVAESYSVRDVTVFTPMKDTFLKDSMISQCDKH